MAPAIIGLDVGPAAVRAAVLRGSARRWSVLDFLSADVDGVGAEAQARAVRSVLDAAQEDNPTLVAAMPLERCSSWLVSLPFRDDKRIAQTLPFEVEGQVPWDLDDVQLTWTVADQDEGGARIFVGMAHKDRVRGRLDALLQGGADPRHLGLDAAALSHLLPDDGGVVVDLGGERTLVCVVVAGRPRFARSLDRGVLSFRAELEEGALGPGFRQWAGALRSTLLAAERAGCPLDRLLLTGEGARIQGLCEHLHQDLGVPTTVLQPPQPSLRPEEAPRCEPEHSLALALALRALQSRGGLEFRTGDFARQQERARMGKVVLFGAAALGFAAALLFGWTWWGLRGATKELQDAQKELAASVQGAFPEVPTTSLATTQQSIAVTQEKVTATEQKVAALSGPALTALDVVRELSQTIPEAIVVDVDELIVDSESIRIRGRTDSFGSVDRIEAALIGNPSFAGAKKSDVNKNNDGKTRFLVTIPREPGEEQGQ